MMTSPQPSPYQGEGENKNVLLVIGRDEKDNENLEKLANAGDVIIQLADENGPTSLIRSKKLEVKITNEIREVNVPKELKLRELKLGEKKNEKEIMEIAIILTGYYATKLRGKKIRLKTKIIN